MTIRVLDDAKLCRRLTAEAFEHLSRFDWGDVAERTDEVYAEVVALDVGCPTAGVRSIPRATRRPSGGRPTSGLALNVSVPISFGLPLLVVGIALIAAAATTGRTIFWIFGAVAAVAGVLLFASGKRL